ncbi:MAG: TMEM175 family protein [Silanimonas sp.]
MATFPPVATARDAMGFRHRGDRTTRLEAFVDAAFAFALTLVIVMVGDLPRTAAELQDAAKSIPAFAACFWLLATFWRGHVDWSERFGLDDGRSRGLSLLLIFLVLVFVFPLRIVFATFFAWISGGWLPVGFDFEDSTDIQLMFQMFALAFGSMGATLWALNLHAWRCRAALGLDATESDALRLVLVIWGLVPVFAVISLALSWWPESLRWGAPGMIFFVMHGVMAVLRARHRRRLAGVLASPVA